MSGTILVGTSFGDEGKGGIADYISQDADMVVRPQGGPNAGHTLVVNDEKTILRLIPSGILNESVKCVLAQGMVIDPFVLHSEIKSLIKKGVKLKDRLFISNMAHVITPNHLAEDRSEHSANIGTTKKGVGPAYADKASRKGVRLGKFIQDVKAGRVDKHSFDWAVREAVEDIQWFVCDTSELVYNALVNNGNVIFEGAQGTLLDIDHGTYPYVTSSNTIAAGACTGSGIGPTMIDEVIGISKAYMTRVGEGPFPTQIKDDVEKSLRDAGNEYGSVTGRARRVGWLDLPMLKYSVRINGITSLALTKIDVLSYESLGFDEINVCVDYLLDDETCEYFPLSRLSDVEPIYMSFLSWKAEHLQSKLAGPAKEFVKFIEDYLKIPVSIISYGASRESTFKVAA